MKVLSVNLCLTAAMACVVSSCSGAESCTQGNVDECYLSVGCDGSEYCTLTTERMNGLCACLDDLDCNQDWYHAYCDGAPYEDGECGSCDLPDAGD